MKRNVTDDERFGELIQQNDNSGKNNQFDVFIFQHIFASKGSEVLGSAFRVSELKPLAAGSRRGLPYFKAFKPSCFPAFKSLPAMSHALSAIS
jgi:hypothetical protein